MDNSISISTWIDLTWTYSATCRNLLSLCLFDTRRNMVRNSLRQPIFTICTNRSDRLAADIWLTLRKDITYDQTLYEQMPKHTCR